MSSRAKAISGIIWTFIDSVLLKALSLLSFYILARLLTDEDYGLNGILIPLISIGTTIVESGLSNSLIRASNPTQDEYSTIFWMNIFTAILLYVGLYFAIPYIIDYIDKPIPTEVLRISALSIIFSSFTTVQLAILTKEMQFKKLMIANIPSAIISPTLGVALAYYGYGIWALVGMALAAPFFQSISLWTASNWRPSFIFVPSKAKFHLSFGYKLLLSALLDNIFKNIYNFIIPKRYTLSSLGQYERANTLNGYPTNILTTIVSKVTYPLLTNIKDNTEEISNAYRQILRMSLYISAPIMLALAATAPSLILFLLGEDYRESIPYFQIICLASMLYPIHSINLNVLKVYGRSDLFLKLEVIKKILTIVCIAVAWNFGIIGLVWSSVAASALSLLVNTYYSDKLIQYSTKQQIFEMLPTLFTAGAMYTVILLTSNFIQEFPPLLQIFVNFTIGFLFYFILSYIFKLKPFLFLVKIIKSYRP
ncbi:Membrane protein involved in the export of O-antigen and teichoic acid [Sphingobacterium nematocida]|uniref:Membrane protein involved in the export of O-antigen and teichoic acid n=1 Tax=Sphingobacterium nematocida TaxID=1513896 RepID=A0A1T5D5Z0_9SPHI|nr:lipopolysaccharide biosynthesis protein [Sphingobacterium nematocida]SKB67089.1 Membrane protein involved in the export of O-antigen and teichoic acid [Sphingobacterium nematocida]